ncbi:hypothetical protein COCMIDRAFT_93640 [Bipolaris oryzae ATCC 44560]|uniref:C2H2-type domain-containing protein n=1 Tax=Bipolaris oryzae ATCC 44560 TaxID=930090 RepID=W6Z808_COCMI|nr:uncharacterized protein COCMIDRAFT_93640 [Bipolaris oryzae ATCC 44560]EUC46140.1 hypothetical protein COCMIDRAFT_93640 [Bipolaris oryzae ATCC 44560]
MALKRKVTDEDNYTPSKRSQIGAAADTTELDYASDDSADWRVNYTDNGKLRAESEARRQWNYVCPMCSQRFNRPCRLETHMRSHNKERPFACTELGCDKTFPRKDHLQRHLKNAHSDPATERTFVCDWNDCGKSFTSNGRLQRHRDVHESKFHCTEYPPCNESFRKAKSLEAHVKSQHLAVKPYVCTHVDEETGQRCTSGFQTEGALQRHVGRSHNKTQEQGHFCMLCVDVTSEGKMPTDSTDTQQLPSFATKEELDAHTAEFHPPVCIECGQKFKSASTLKTHFETAHGDPQDQRQYPCPRLGCESVFNRKHNLTVHIQNVHDKQFNYVCAAEAVQTTKHADLKAWNGQDACGASFKARSSLDQHIRKHHLNLGNRKQLRQAAKSKKKPEASMLTMLTGVGYEKDRDIPCLVENCAYCFYLDRDLRRHLRAEHHLSDDEMEEKILERDAMTGGQFWIGGFDESMNLFADSATPSMPETPGPYFTNGSNTPMLPCSEPDPKGLHHLGSGGGGFNQQFDHLGLADEEAEMDLGMGLADLPPAVDVQGELQWDMLVPVEQYNSDVTRG